ncbi:unnamed protein product [Darwinula stevensoni]|uniref:Doublecortin domain-containing protein n=1 Tax=Darwinula stevensoni TaxID=69355 RepID=A0A7R8X5P9_9CRUS|nr:unnamed protein product [Darwinula stevensoni]CAG0886866.1 unnamed protein product [Darwinula stevensoni]
MSKGNIANIRSHYALLRPVNAPTYYKGGKATSQVPGIPQQYIGYRSPRNGYSEIEYDKSDEEDYRRPKYEVGKPRKLAVEDDEDYIKTRAPTRASVYSETRRNSSAGRSSRGYPILQRSSSYDPIKIRRSHNPRKVKVVTFYKNGDSNFTGFQFWLRPGRDVRNLDVLCKLLSARIPGLPLGVKYIFNMDGDVIRRLEEIQDGETYVCSSNPDFKRSSSYDPIKIRRSHNPRKVKVVTFYKNGDSNFTGFQFWLRPGRDVRNLDVLCKLLSARIPGLPLGVKYIFNMDGDVIRRLEEIQDGETYVCSSNPDFKEQIYGLKVLSSWRKTAKTQLRRFSQARTRPSTPDDFSPFYSDTHTAFPSNGRSPLHPDAHTAFPSNGRSPLHPDAHTAFPSNGRSPLHPDAHTAFPSNGRSPLHPDAHTAFPSNGRSPLHPDAHTAFPSNGRSPLPASPPRRKRRDSRGGMRIWGNCLLSTKTGNFEEVRHILGQVLNMRKVKAMYTLNGEEVRSLSQLSHYYDNAEQDTFFLEEDRDIPSPPRQTKRSLDRDSNSEILRPTGNHQTVLFQRLGGNGTFPDTRAAGKDAVTVTIRGRDHVLAKPSHVPPSNATAPEKQLHLDWVYGFRGADTKRNLWVLPKGELLYFVATVVVVYDVQQRDRQGDKQRHYTEHTEDVTCLAVHPGKDLVASGQRAGYSQDGKDPGPHIRIWSLAKLTTLKTLNASNFTWVGAVALAFSVQDGGKHLAGVTEGQGQELLVWEWNKDPQKAVARAQTNENNIVGLAFHSKQDLIITYGGRLATWKRERGSAELEREDLVDEELGSAAVTCLKFMSAPKEHLLTGHANGVISVWSFDRHGKYTLDEEFQLPKIVGGVRGIQAGKGKTGSHEELLVGTTKNQILQGTLETTFQPVVFGHASQLWALAVHPSQPVFATAGYDRNIVKWRAHKLEWRVESECSCATWNGDGSLLAVGSITGHVTVLRGENGELLVSFLVGPTHVSCISFSPDESLLSMGAENGNVYLYKVDKAEYVFRRSAVIKVSLPLTHMDWSTDSQYIRTQSEDAVVIIWDAKRQLKETDQSWTRDISWATHNCTLSYFTYGMWKSINSTGEVSISTCDISRSKKLLLAGDADGRLFLFRYPSTDPKAKYHTKKVYTAYISSARFLQDDNIIAAGGTDAALMQWRLA